MLLKNVYVGPASPRIYIFHIYTRPKFTQTPHLHQTQIYRNPDLHRCKYGSGAPDPYLHSPDLHKPIFARRFQETQIYTTQINTKPKFTQPKFTQSQFTQGKDKNTVFSLFCRKIQTVFGFKFIV